MRLPASPRAALAAPTQPDNIYVQSCVILTVSILSMLGALWIILSFACFSRLRSFRHQLILGLAISDFFMAVNFLLSTAMNVSGRYIGAPEQAEFCSFNGFMTQVFVIQTDYWVLVIAICTCCILADHKRMSGWLQDHRAILASLPWIFSLLWAVIGLNTAGYGDIGAWCWFTSDKVRLFANFLPRWAIIAIILIMYLSLYVMLYRAHNRFESFNESSSHPTEPGSTSTHVARSTEPRRAAVQKSTPRLKRMARLMLMYPIAYMLIWTLPTVVRVYQSIRGIPAPFVLQTCDKACIVIQGFVDAIIYGLNESCINSWRNFLFPKALPQGDGYGNDQAPGANSADFRARFATRSRQLDEVPGDSVSTFEVELISGERGFQEMGADFSEPTGKCDNSKTKVDEEGPRMGSFGSG